MNTEAIDSLRHEITDELASMPGLSRYAELFAVDTIQQMAADGKAIELTDDEERMLRAYRRHRERSASGVFSWKFADTRSFVVPAESPSLIVDPSDVSKTQLVVV